MPTVRWDPKGMRRSSGPQSIEKTNRSAKDGARSSLHYGGEGATHPPIVPRCVRAARCGRSMRYPGRARRVPEWCQDKRPYKRKAKWEAKLGEQSDGRVVPEAQ